MANISTLTVSLVAETGKFSNGLKKAKKDSSAFGKAAAKAMKGAAIATAAFGAALGALVFQSLKLVDQQRKTARTLGTSQAVFAGLSLAAGIAGLEVAGFTKALKRQQKSIVDATDGLQTQKRAFDRLGISATDLLKLPVEEQFKTITQALGTVENATLKVAIASDIYGAKNADLINILDLGADGLDHFIDKAKELGVALTDTQTNAIEQTNDALLVMKTAFTGLGNQLAARFSPAITFVAEAITGLVSSVTNSIPAWQAWAASILGVTRNLNDLTLADLDAEIHQIGIDALETTTRLTGFKRALEQRKGRDLAAETGRDKEQAALDLLIERTNLLIARRNELREQGEVNIPGRGGGSDDDAPITSGRTRFKPFEIGRVDEFGNSLSAIGKELEANFALFDEWEREAAAAFDSTRTPMEALMIRLQELRENPFIDGELQNREILQAVEDYKAGLEKLKAASDKMAEEMTEFQREAMRNMQGIFADFLFDPFEEGVDGMLKSFATMLRKMVAQLIAQKVLTAFFGLFTGGSVLSSASSGGSGTPSTAGRAIGGSATAGQSVTVGERGAELFTPGASGSIRPLGAINFSPTTQIGGGGGVDIATLIPLLEENNKKVKSELLDEFDRGSFR